MEQWQPQRSVADADSEEQQRRRPTVPVGRLEPRNPSMTLTVRYDVGCPDLPRLVAE